MNKMEKAANLLVVLAAVSIIGMNVYDRFAPREDIRQMRAQGPWRFRTDAVN